MESLPNDIKIQILKFIPRRVHPSSIMIKQLFCHIEHVRDGRLIYSSWHPKMWIHKPLYKSYLNNAHLYFEKMHRSRNNIIQYQRNLEYDSDSD